MNINELREEYASLFNENQKLINAVSKEKRNFTTDESIAKERRFARMDEIKHQVDETLRLEAAAAAAAFKDYKPVQPKGQAEWENPAAVPSDEPRSLRSSESFSKALGTKPEIGFGDFLRATVLGPRNDAERFALVRASDSTGGYEIPTGTVTNLVDSARGRSQFVRAGALTVPLNGFQNKVARLASNPAPSWRAEGDTVPGTLAFSGVALSPKAIAVKVKISRELMEDALNVNETLQDAFSAAFASEIDRVVGWGAGSNEPSGLQSVSGILSVASAANGDQLTDYSKFLTAQYNLQLNSFDASAVVLSPREAKTVNGFKDTTNQPLRRPESLTGIPFYASANVPINQTQGTSNIASTILMGDFSRVIIGIRTQLRIEVLRETDADTLEYGFLAYFRMDSALSNVKSICKITGIVP